MAEDDVELGHVVDLTLGEPSGTELVAAAAIGATTLTVDYAGDFEDVGEVVLNGTTLAYTAIAYGAAEADPDVITLAAPLAAAAVVDDKVVRVSGGEPLSDWLLHVSLGDGHPVDIPIPFEQRALWSSVDTSTPVPVMVSADLERLVEVPGRTPTMDLSYADASTLDVDSLPPLPPPPPTQTFSTSAPSATAGYDEDHAWWQVDGSGNVLGFWRLIGGVWVAQTIVTADALIGKTIRTAASGRRAEVVSTPDNMVAFYSGSGSEQLPGYIEADVSGSFARLKIAAPDTDEPNKATDTYRNIILMYEDVTDASVNRTSRTVTVRTSHFYIETAGGDQIHFDGSGGTPAIDFKGGLLNNFTGGVGSVGVDSFRDSVDARVSTVAPTVTMTTGGVGTGAFRDAVDARANAMSAARMQAGTASSGTVVAATTKTVTVTFPTAFSSAPKVTLTSLNSDPGVDRRVAVVPGSETTTTFQVAFWRATGTASFDTNWLAVKP